MIFVPFFFCVSGNIRYADVFFEVFVVSVMVVIFVDFN